MSEPKNREKQIFSEALEMGSPEARAGYLRGACGKDQDLRGRVEALLKAYESDGNFIPNRTSLSEEIPTMTVPVQISEGPGTVIDCYKLLQQIGEGGCGVVYMAEQEEPVRRRVALKVIKLGMDTKQVVARFEAERQALAMMDHPNIAKVLEAGATETGRPYFVMELVRGIKITEFCDQKKLSTRERLDLFMQVCSAIQHAHQKGIIHRDLKPSNILVTVNDGSAVPKVIDFGIAKATNQQRLTDKTLFTAFEQFIGTPAYMSPEQAEMTSLDIDTRSDIYSLGVVLYELLTGRTPFDAEKLMQSGVEGIRRTLREDEPPKPSTRISTLPEMDLTTAAKVRQVEPAKFSSLLRGDLDWIVMKCLEKDRARRYDTANGLVMDLKRYLGNEPVLARPPSTAYLLQKLVRRHKLAFASGGAVLVALLLGVVASTWQAILARQAKRDAEAAAMAARRSEKLADTARLKAQDLLTFVFTDLTGQLFEIGQMSALQQLSENAVAYYEGLPKDLQTRDTRSGYALALGTVGMVLDSSDELKKARVQLERARTIFGELEVSGPLTPLMRVAFGNVSSFLAQKCYTDKRYFEALPICEHAEKVLEPALADPQWGGWAQRELTEVLDWKGWCLTDGGRPRDAVPEFQRALASAEEADRRPPLPKRPGLRTAELMAAMSTPLYYQDDQHGEARRLAEKARLRLREFVEREPNLVRGRFGITAADWAIICDTLRQWEFAGFQSAILEEQSQYAELLKLDSKSWIYRGNLAWTWYDSDVGQFGYDWLQGNFTAAENDARNGLDLLAQGGKSAWSLDSMMLSQYHWARVCAATARDSETEHQLAEASAVMQRIQQEPGNEHATNIQDWAVFQNELRLIEFNRLNWPAMRQNAADALDGLARSHDKQVDENLRNNKQEEAYHHLIRAEFEAGDYTAARRDLDLFKPRARLAAEMDLQRRFDFVGTQLTRILVLARAGEADAARAALAGLWPEGEAVFAAGPQHHFNQVQMARALSVKAEVDKLDLAVRRALLERALGYLRPASAAGRLTRYEREILLAGIEKKLAQ